MVRGRFSSRRETHMPVYEVTYRNAIHPHWAVAYVKASDERIVDRHFSPIADEYDCREVDESVLDDGRTFLWIVYDERIVWDSKSE